MRHRLAIVDMELQDFMDIQTKWMMETSQLKWIVTGNQCPKYLIATFKQLAIQRDIASI